MPWGPVALAFLALAFSTPAQTLLKPCKHLSEVANMFRGAFFTGHDSALAWNAPVHGLVTQALDTVAIKTRNLHTRR